MTSTLRLMPRDAFAAFTLAEKNAYLQTLADEFAADNNREPAVLDKDALSRLRRYYSRRVWADLKLDAAPDNDMNKALRRLGDAIRMEGVQIDIAGAILAETKPKKVLRTAPVDDAQLMFFVPGIYDAPIKDDVNLMDVAPFSLSKKARNGVIQYELKDSLITIEGGADSGIATVFDYDIFIHMVSWLADEVRKYRISEAKGLRPSLPPSFYRPNIAHILKFCRRSSGGRQYEEIEGALKRLKHTNISVVNLFGGDRRKVDDRSLIEDYTVLSTTSTGKVDLVEITIPQWVYKTVVKNDKALPLLTMHGDYFLISSGLGRFIYRLARKAAGKDVARYGAKEIYKRSGSTQEFRFFLRDLREFVVRTQLLPMPEYDLSLEEGKENAILVMLRRDDSAPATAKLPQNA